MSFDLSVPAVELNLAHTFTSGQTFRWSGNNGIWEGPLDGGWVRLSHNRDCLSVESTGASVTPESIRRFLRLDVSLADVARSAAEADPRIGPLFSRYRGLRVLRQDPVECLLSFVCAVVTSIPRIRWSVEELSRSLGQQIAPGRWCFPSLDALADASPEVLRVGGMEFRCRNLSKAARTLRALGGEEFLRDVALLPYSSALQKLTQIPGVGRKIADCALLFSLGHDEAFPLDTHTWRLAEALYGLPASARTPKAYAAAAQLLRDRFGQMAGWAQQYLYFFSLLESRSAGYPFTLLSET